MLLVECTLLVYLEKYRYIQYMYVRTYIVTMYLMCNNMKGQ